MDGFFGKYIEFEVPEGAAVIEKATFSTTEISGDHFNIDLTTGRVVLVDIEAKGELKVMIDGAEYIVNYN